MDGATDPDSSIEIVAPRRATGGTAPAEPPAAKPAEKPAEAGVVHLKMRKKTLWSLIITGVVVILGVAAWYTDVYGKLLAVYNAASVTVSVKEDGSLALAEATVRVGETEYTTDATGQVEIAKITAGTYKLKVSKDGYVPAEEDWTIARGENEPKTITLSKRQNPVYTLEGTVRDYVSELALADVQVSVSGETARSNPAGQFSFKELEAGSYVITFSKSGFITKEATITLGETENAGIIDLVPNGQVVFVSNREGGKQGIYSSLYDGSEQKRLIANQGGEDFGPIVSPDGRYLAFVSTRDGLKDQYGQEAYRLYLADRDGSNVRKVGDEIAVSYVRWSPDSRYLFYYGAADTNYSSFVARVYNVAAGSVFVLEDGFNGADATLLGSNALLYYPRYVTTDGTVTGTLSSVNVTNGERRTLYSWTEGGYGSLNSLRLTADGRSLTFTIQTSSKKYYRLNLATLDTEELSSDPVDERRLLSTNSPDGRLAAFVTNRDGKVDVFTLDLTGAEKQLTNLGGFQTVPRLYWDQSMRYVIAARRDDNTTSLYVVSTEGGASKKVVDFYFGSAEYGIYVY